MIGRINHVTVGPTAVTVNPTTVLNNSWNKLLGEDFIYSKYFTELSAYVSSIYRNKFLTDRIKPGAISLVFRPFKETIVQDVKVVIIGDHITEGSTGLIFGSHILNYHSERHVKLFEKFDITLMDWCKKGILPLTYSPINISIPGKFSTHSGTFKKFYIRALKALYKQNPNVIIAVSDIRFLDIINLADIPQTNVVKGIGYYSTVESVGTNIYKAINERLKSMHQEPVEF